MRPSCELLGELKNLVTLADAQGDIFDFYLLWWAYDDLQHSDEQQYWPGATRNNIVTVVREKARQFIAARRQDV